MAFNYLENSNTLSLLKNYPAPDDARVNSASRITSMKRVLVTFAFLPVLPAAAIGCLCWWAF